MSVLESEEFADVRALRADFPQLRREIHGQPLAYLDTAATSLKPQAVIDRISRFYSWEYGTVRRGVYTLSQEATAMFEGVRAQAARFLGAASANEIVFVRGVTEGMNLLAHTLGSSLGEGDEILITEMEHHANILPWQLVAQRTGARIVVAEIDERGNLRLDDLAAKLSDRTRIVSVVHVSNALGTVNPVAEVAKLAAGVGAKMIVDGAQSAPHLPIDVAALGCDFYLCSGHKMLGPTGAGLLWGRAALLAELPPFMGGGEMIDHVTYETSTYEDPPHRFEPGTPAIASVIGLGAAMTYLEAIGMERLHAWDRELVAYATEAMSEVPALRFSGDPDTRSGLVPFTVEGVHPFDLGTLLDHHGVAIRVGHHCAQPLMRRLGVPATARASFGAYTNREDIDRFVVGLREVCDMLL